MVCVASSGITHPWGASTSVTRYVPSCSTYMPSTTSSGSPSTKAPSSTLMETLPSGPAW